MSTSNTSATRLRSLYRRLLRELPSRQPSMLANPSPVHQRIRGAFSTDSSTFSSSEQNETPPQAGAVEARMQEAEVYVQYAKAQRLYISLIERYNPGMNMLEEDRVRLTARRVGMDMPADWYPGRPDGKE